MVLRAVNRAFRLAKKELTIRVAYVTLRAIDRILREDSMKKLMLGILILALSTSAFGQRLTYDALIRSARIYLKQVPKDFKSAQQKLEQAIEEFADKKPIEAYMLLGSVHAEKRRFVEMNQMFNAALELCAEAEENNDGDLVKRCEKDKIVENISNIRTSQWIEQFNDGAQLLSDANEYKADCEADKEDMDEGEYEECIAEVIDMNREALRLFENSAVIAPDSSQSWINLGLTYYNIGIRDSAVIAYNKALDVRPDNFDLISNLATIYYEMEDWEKCAHAFGLMSDLEPENTSVLKNYSMLLDRLGDKDSAAAIVDKVLEIDPKDVDMRRSRAISEVIAGADINKQIVELRKQEKAADKETIAELEAQRDTSYAHVIEDFGVVAQEDPSDFDAWYYIGLGNRVLERDADAIAAFEKAVEVKDDPEIWEQLAVLYLKVGESEKSDAALKKSEELSAEGN
jgi:tetratricopeptide (TPR) repeat protein